MTEAVDHYSYVKHCYYRMSEAERKVFCNGVGSEIPRLEWADDVIPEKWKKRMRPEADLHDVGYWMGGGRKERKACDKGTYEGWKTMVTNLPDRLERAEGFVIMATAYRVLRFFGWLSFERRWKPWDLEMLKHYAEQHPA